MPSKKAKKYIKAEKKDEINKNWIFGITRDDVIAELNNFKDIYLDSRKKGIYIPDTLIFNVLKDETPENLKRDILNSLMNWAEEIFEVGPMRCRDYVFKVLYGICMEYIENKLLIKHYDNSQNHRMHLQSDDPIITPINVEWQMSKCSQLQINFENRIDQHSSIAGQKLKHYQPWLCEEIIGDGNCLFRCLSKMISGSEEYHSKIRNELCRYMITEGQELMGWYFHQVHSTTPLKYLKTSDMMDETTWGSDVEIMAASAILETDIYVANKYTSHDNHLTKISWSLIRCSNNTNNTNAIYISSFNSHYEPVIRMINSNYDTYYTYKNENEIESIILDE